MKLHTRFLWFCCLFITQSVAAVEVEGLFTTQVGVHSQSREDRNVALREALVIVVSRLTTVKEFAQEPAVKSALDNAATYVGQYQYVSISDDRKKDSLYRLLVSFNKNTLMGLLRSSGLAVWDENRAKILLWLVVEQKGKQAFLDIDRDAELEEAMQGAAMAKGIPLLLPLMDLEEKQAISVIDILAAKSDKILEVSARYDVATILSGNLVKKRTCWSSEWALRFNNKIERWAVSCTDLKTNLNNALQGVYEYLSVFYALKAG